MQNDNQEPLPRCQMLKSQLENPNYTTLESLDYI